MSTVVFSKGRYRARLASGTGDIAAAQKFRQRCFAPLKTDPGADRDAFDDLCDHVLIERVSDGALLGCYRVLKFQNGATLDTCYTAQFYDLAPLASYAKPLLEVGRFCVPSQRPDPDLLRVAFGALTQIVEGQGIGMLFGCSSFYGTNPAPYRDALSLLADRHVGPQAMIPAPRARNRIDLRPDGYDEKTALRQLPPLLRAYIAMGGWVSNHAVIDEDFGTLHVFTGVEADSIPKRRAQSLRNIVR